ncbi:hypothetical protein FACS189450_09000 [Spirochaetia bacterium]|nr:hypothetical protein FACS189450_09000 [Spirochaetia bacterium]GHU96357.1 hypothetical protein FACS189479_10040 [Spirochaetia bacterium]
MQPPEPFQIIDYQDRAKEGKIPEWVDSYLAEGIRGVENIPEFQNKYVFIGLSEGVNFNALSQWEEAFSPAQDLARLIAFRIGARFTTAVQSDPDDTYGEFFETMIKGASDAQYQGAVKETGFWILRLSPAKETDEESEEQEVNREVYDFLVLISIDKKQLESQINAIFNAAKENINPRKDQAAAINRIGENFFEGF